MSELRIEKVSCLKEFGFAASLRTSVYISEQGYTAIGEFDDIDNTATHYLGWVGDHPVTTCRIFPVEEGVMRIGRIVTLKEYRGKGYASELIKFTIGVIKNDASVHRIILSAQDRITGYYEKFGFVSYGDVIPGHIPHRMMKLEIAHA